MMISSEQMDKIHNALFIGMDLAAAYIYAGLSAEEISWADGQANLQAQWSSSMKEKEYSLLQDMQKATNIQVASGNTTGTQWLLEHLFSRYAGKAPESAGTINLNIKSQDTSDIVEVHNQGENK